MMTNHARMYSSLFLEAKRCSGSKTCKDRHHFFVSCCRFPQKKIQANVEVYHPKEIPIMEIENVDFNNNSVEALDQAEKAETGIIGVAVADDKDDDSEDLKPHRVALVVCLVALKVFGVLLGIVLGTYVGRLVAQKLLGEDD